MADGAVVVVDAGSGGPRCLVFDERGRVAGAASHSWRYATQPDSPALARELDTPATWVALCELFRSALADAEVAPSNVNAVSITGQRQGVVFLDDAGRELYVGPNLDLRAVFEGARLDEESASAIYAATGRMPSLLFTHAKLRWFREHRPRAHARISHVLSLPAWIAWKLTGELADEPSLAAEAGLLDVRAGDWYTPPFAEAGIDPNAVRLVASREFAGATRAGTTGLAQGVPVCIAGPDTQCGLLGMGVANAGEMGIVAGWSAPLQMVTEAPLSASGSGAWTGLFLEGGRGVLECNAGDLGNQQRWLAEVLFGDAEVGFNAMNALAAAAPPGANGATALLGHPRMDTASVGMRTGGILFPAPVTFSEIGRGHTHPGADGVRGLRHPLQPGASRAGGGSSGAGRAAGRRHDADACVGRSRGRGAGPSDRRAGRAQRERARRLRAGGRRPGRLPRLGGGGVRRAGRLAALEPDPVTVAEYEDAYGRWTALTKEMEGWDAVSAKFAEARRAVASAAREMAALGLATGSSGNVSLRLAGGLFAVTPSGVPYTRLRDEEVVIIDGEAEPVEPADGGWSQPDLAPSSETLLHLAIYAARPDAGAVVHTHAVYTSVAAVAGLDVPPIIDEMMLSVGGPVRVSEYRFPGTQELADSVVAALGERNAALIRNHGAVGVGRDLDSALNVCALVERMAHIFVFASLLGGANPLPPEAVETELALYRMRRASEG